MRAHCADTYYEMNELFNESTHPRNEFFIRNVNNTKTTIYKLVRAKKSGLAPPLNRTKEDVKKRNRPSDMFRAKRNIKHFAAGTYNMIT
jgi:hypothetical protein